MQKISTFLWFDDKAEEAANFYVSLFPNSKITNETRNGPGGPGPEGSILVIQFELDGQEYLALNGGPMFKFTPAISLMINCETQEEVDRYWDKLVEGGEPNQCGWLTDRYGLSWQVIPTILGKLLSDPDRERAGRAMGAMMQMVKIDGAALQRAFDGE